MTRGAAETGRAAEKWGTKHMRLAAFVATGGVVAALALAARAQPPGAGDSSKACVLGTGVGVNITVARVSWQSVTPVPDSWTWKDCQNLAHAVGFDVVALGCMFGAGERDGKHLDADFAVGAFWAPAGRPTEAQLGATAIPHSSSGRDCGW